MGHRVFLGLGSNMGQREENIRHAIALIGERVGPVERQSSLIETEPWGYESPNRFLNGVVCCSTELTPHQLLQTVKRIEKEMGRENVCIPQPASGVVPSDEVNLQPKVRRRYADRPIDIDILLYDDLHVNDPDLVIPHPLMRQREFVMVPFREITSEQSFN